MYCNLLTEMLTHKPEITKLHIAECLKISEKRAGDYLNGASEIPWSKALKIKNTFFPELSMEYLFEFKLNGEPQDFDGSLQYKNLIIDMLNGINSVTIFKRIYLFCLSMGSPKKY